MRRQLLTAVLVSTLLHSIPSAADEISRKELTELYDQATDLAEAGKFDEAREIYMKLWTQRETYDIALNLAEIAFKKGEFASAATYARFGLENFPPSELPKLREHFESLYEKTLAETGLVVVQAPNGAAVTVDGRSLGRSPVRDVFLDPGEHKFEATYDGVVTSKDVVIGKGETVNVELRPAPRAPVRPISPPDDDGLPPKSPPYRTIAVITGGALTAISLATHVGLRARGAKLNKDADNLRDEVRFQYGANACESVDGGICADLSSTLDKRARTAVWERVTFASTLAFGAATAAAVVVWPRRKPTENQATLQPWVGPGTGGISFQGSF